MTPTRLVSLCLLWLTCMLAVCGCAYRIGLELAVPAPDSYAIALLGCVSAALLVMATALTAIAPSSPRPRQHGNVTLPAMLALLTIGAVACSACGAVKKESKAIAGDVVKCSSEPVKNAERELGPVIEDLVRSAIQDDGKVDTARLKELTKPFSTVAWCVLENTAARIVARVSRPEAPQSSPLDISQLEPAIAELRAQQFPGITFIPATD